jgi:putative AlgH/UPF0301 family transcriptional regulator
MKIMTRVFSVLMMVAVLVGNACGTVAAQDLSEGVMLVATAKLDGTLFQQTVVIAAPLPNGSHVGFIINRPTTVKLDSLLPDEESSRNVVDHVSQGGPLYTNGVFAVARGEASDKSALPLVPGLFAVLDSQGVDRTLAKAPNDARYFIGLITRTPNQLKQQIDSGDWGVKRVDVDTVFCETPGLWSALRSTMHTSDATGTSAAVTSIRTS